MDDDIAVGDSVKWSWTGSNSHSVTPDSGGFTGSPVQANPGTWTQTFNVAGQFAYH